MSNGYKRNRKILLIPVLLLLALIALAGVFVYLPITISVNQQQSPVFFETGSNANQQDIGSGNTIGVTIGSNSTSANLALHPTYQKTYYKDILKISNGDTQAYNVYIRVNSPVSLPSGSTAKLYVNNVAVDLTTAGTTKIGSLSGSGTWSVDVEFYIPEGNQLVSTSASISLIYSPSSETPP